MHPANRRTTTLKRPQELLHEYASTRNWLGANHAPESPRSAAQEVVEAGVGAPGSFPSCCCSARRVFAEPMGIVPLRHSPPRCRRVVQVDAPGALQLVPRTRVVEARAMSAQSSHYEHRRQQGCERSGEPAMRRLLTAGAGAPATAKYPKRALTEVCFAESSALRHHYRGSSPMSAAQRCTHLALQGPPINPE